MYIVIGRMCFGFNGLKSTFVTFAVFIVVFSANRILLLCLLPQDLKYQFPFVLEYLLCITDVLIMVLLYVGIKMGYLKLQLICGVILITVIVGYVIVVVVLHLADDEINTWWVFELLVHVSFEIIATILLFISILENEME